MSHIYISQTHYIQFLIIQQARLGGGWQRQLGCQHEHWGIPAEPLKT